MIVRKIVWKIVQKMMKIHNTMIMMNRLREMTVR